jgi:hypothetical protein
MGAFSPFNGRFVKPLTKGMILSRQIRGGIELSREPSTAALDDLEH